jgi:serine protease Do
MARAFGLAGQPRGALINDVTADSPAASAGLAKGDIVLEVDGEAVADARALNLKIAALPPNAVVHLKVTREGKERVLSVELGEMPVAAPAVRAPRVAAETDSGPRLGLSVHPLTPEMAHELGFASPILGVLIDNIQPGSPADEADLQRGDVIEEINGTAITKVEEFQTALRRTRNGQILLLIARGSTHLFVVLEPGMRTG